MQLLKLKMINMTLIIENQSQLAKNKVLIMNKLFLPQEILSTIFSYSFNTILNKYIKIFRKCVIFEIKNAFISRKNLFHIQIEDGNEENWSFAPTMDSHLYLQAINCSKCGNYKHSHTDFLSSKLICRCLLFPVEYY